MMKMKKHIVFLLVLILCLALVSVSAAKRELTVKRAVAINDTQIIIEFSEPIAINKVTSNRGPYVAIRILDSSGGLQKITNIKSPNYGTNLQWAGSLQYVDSKHDRLLWTMTGKTLDMDSISDIVNFTGELSEYTKCKVGLVMEEVPYDETKLFTDNAICNVTTRDGEVHLTPTIPSSWEKCIMPIEVNYGYRVDLSATETTKEPVIYEYALIGEGIVGETVESEVVEPNYVLRNDPMIIIVILVGGILIGGTVMLVLILTKKRKAA